MAKPQEKPRIVWQKVVDRQNQVIAERPEEVPALANLCKKITATIETGQDYRIVPSGKGA